MTVVFAVVALCALAVAVTVWCLSGWQLRYERSRHREDIAFERARVNELYQLLEAKATPTEYAAYVHSPTPAHSNVTWLSSEDGLISVALDPEDD